MSQNEVSIVGFFKYPISCEVKWSLKGCLRKSEEIGRK